MYMCVLQTAYGVSQKHLLN